MYDYNVETFERLESPCLCAVWAGPSGPACLYPCAFLRARITKYDLTLDTYSQLLRSQHGLCALCGVKLSTLPPRTVVIDHDHTTGRVRGIVCQSCNSRLRWFDANGFASEDAWRERARRYVAKPDE